MKTTLEDISAVKKKLLIEIESPEVDKKLNEAYRDLGRQAKIPGFRPGKVPRKILEGRFGNQVLEDVIKGLISETFPQAINEVKAFPLGPPLLEKETLKQGQNFKYSAVMEVRPQFEVKDYLGIDVEKEKFSVTDEDVREQLEQIRESNGKLTSVEKQRPVQKNDYVVLDYEGFVDDSPLEGIKAPNFLLKVGSNDFHPKFEESLIGLNKESETEIIVDFEETYRHSKLAGKSVKFKTKITDIKEMVLPDLNDEFAKNLGAEFKDIEDLKDKVRESMTAQVKKRIDRDLKQRLIDKISEGVDLELPQVLVDSEIDYAFQTLKQNLIRSGSNLENAGFSEDKLRQDFKPASEKRVKDMLVLGEIAKLEEITVEEEDLTEGYKDLAASMGQDPETLRKYYEARNLVDSLKEKLLEEKTLNYLVEHANITEVDQTQKIEDNDKKEKD